MSRLLVPADKNSWYDELFLIFYYGETEFERIIKQHVNSVFPDYITLSYKKLVHAKNMESRKPDLVLIRNNYEDWWIVEVELKGHPLEHVVKQVAVFSNGEYNSYQTAEYIEKRYLEEYGGNLDFEKIRSLIASKQPNVLVIVDEPKPEWEESLKFYNAKLCVFQVFQNTAGVEAYRLDGHYPDIVRKESHCKYHKVIPNLLEVIEPSVLGVKVGQEINIKYYGRITKWKRIDEGGSVYLKAIGGINIIPSNKLFVLYIDIYNQLTLKIN